MSQKIEVDIEVHRRKNKFYTKSAEVYHLQLKQICRFKDGSFSFECFENIKKATVRRVPQGGCHLCHIKN